MFFGTFFLLGFEKLLLKQNFGPALLTATIGVTPFLEREWLFSLNLLSFLDSSGVVLIGPGE